MEQHWQLSFKSPIGSLYLVASSRGLSGVYTKRQQRIRMIGLEISQKTKESAEKRARQHLLRAKRQLIEYFSGQRQQFELDLDLKGTEFQIKVWKALQRIPYGSTVSYQKIAQQIKKPKAMRAVGSANGKNPICIIVPCHRVIAADGSIGGYSGGLKMKRQLLEVER